LDAPPSEVPPWRKPPLIDFLPPSFFPTLHCSMKTPSIFRTYHFARRHFPCLCRTIVTSFILPLPNTLIMSFAGHEFPVRPPLTSFNPKRIIGSTIIQARVQSAVHRPGTPCTRRFPPFFLLGSPPPRNSPKEKPAGPCQARPPLHLPRFSLQRVSGFPPLHWTLQCESLLRSLLPLSTGSFLKLLPRYIGKLPPN